AQLIDRRERPLHLALARDAEVVGVGGDRADQLRRVAEPLELGHRHPRVTALRVRVAVVVEVVQQPREPPQLLLAAAVARLPPRRRRVSLTWIAIALPLGRSR